ncbi:MAG: tetratricopeptide repeat protein [Candidatus Acidiferrum sp.]
MGSSASLRVKPKHSSPFPPALAAPAVVSPPAPNRWALALRTICAVSALLLLVAASYFNSLQNGFTWDDQQQIVMNPGLGPETPLRRLLFSDVWAFSPMQGAAAGNAIYYRPLQMATYRATVALAGLDPAAFHFLSILCMGVSTILCLFLFWMLTRRLSVAFAAAALFAVHPIHTEAVDWAAAIGDIGCTVFLLAAFMLFLLATKPVFQQNPQPRLRPNLSIWALSVLSFAIAILWKETAAIFPLLVAAYTLIVPSKSPVASRLRNVAILSLPFWVVLAAYLFLRFQVMGHIAASLRTWQLTALQLALTVSHLMQDYWYKLFVPVPLNAYYVFSPVQSVLSLAAVSAALFLLLAALAILYFARRIPLLAFAALWVFITLLPVMDIYAVGRNVLTERYLFLPSVGFCLFLTMLAFEVSRWLPQRSRKPISVAALVGILLLFSYETRARNRDWKDDAVLFTKTLEMSPNSPFVLNMVANIQAAHDPRSLSAEAHHLQALELASAERPPDRLQMVRACEGLASIYSDRSDFPHAIEYLDRVRTIDPSDPEVDGEEGLILTKAGRWDEAAHFLQRAVANSHENDNVLNALGLFAQQHTHNLDQAAAYFSRALAIHTAPDDFNASLHNNLGAVYGDQGRFADAIKEFQMAISITPNDPEYLTNLASALAASGRYSDASTEIRAALAISPGYEPARDVLRQLTAAKLARQR